MTLGSEGIEAHDGVATAPSRRRMVLNVNDDEASRYVFTRMLRQAGFDVLEATTGGEALSLAAAQPDAMLLDIKLPDMTGFEVCARIRRDPSTASMTVLHTSVAQVSVDKRVRGLDGGADGFLPQPFESGELAATLRALLRARDAEEQAIAAARQWQAAFDAMRHAVCVRDRSGRVLRANGVMTTLLGLRRSEVLGAVFETLVRGAFGVETGSRIVAATSGSQRGAVEVDVDTQCFSIAVDPVREGNDRVGEVIVLTDVTERKRAHVAGETALARAQALRLEAERVSELKDELLAMVSHELRTPLTAMLGWLRMLRSGRMDPARVEQALETIERNASAQARLVEDLLDGARIVSGKLHLSLAPMDLGDAARAAIDAARPIANRRDVSLVLLPVEEPLAIEGDAMRLQQVVGNLLSNAIKFAATGGRVEVQLGRIDTHVALHVRDDGVGIAEDFLPYVFERFRQADSSRTRAHGGLGLGLAITRQLVEMHGGTVRAHSEGENRGATFTVTIPLRALAEGADAPAPEATVTTGRVSWTGLPDLTSVRVVLVDDDDDLRELLTTVLADQGADVRSVATASDAFEAIATHRPHVLVSDIAMPGEDGFALIERVRALRPEQGGGVPAIALTAYARMRDGTEALARGFHVHVAKPVDPAAFIATIARLAGDARAHEGRC